VEESNVKELSLTGSYTEYSQNGGQPIFVLEIFLLDYYPVYQVNAYIKDANQLAQVYSDLHQNIQNRFNEEGIEIMSPHYIATRDGSATTIPKDDLRPKK